ncbi:MAG: zf-TFIIB domain-containing protein [Candidatus Omnitrophica bacterium]|nr:zf-TFIIB domain-containing protein [Candidatus Omnitrophota bacterium]MBU1997598.1 zf-TFIIB domain-containing protein [Candidatus Omnitrophota bacterium]
MNCPVCETAMIEEDLGGVLIDICSNGCNGIWFDWFELEKLDETHEGLGKALTAALQSSRAKDDDRGKIKCPKCFNPMVAHLYKSAKEVTVDECYVCGGFFLDSGELKVIRENFMTEEQRESYVNDIIAGQSDFQEAKQDLEKQKLRTAAIRKLTKCLRPSDHFRK